MADLTITHADLWQALAAPQGTDAPLVRVAKLDLPIITSNALRKLKRKAVDAVTDVQESHTVLSEKYAMRDDDGNKVPAPEGNGWLLADADGYKAEFEALMAESVTLADCRKITLKELGDAKISAETLDALEAFLADE
jgi:hypothetical protein